MYMYYHDYKLVGKIKVGPFLILMFPFVIDEKWLNDRTVVRGMTQVLKYYSTKLISIG